LLTLEWPGRKIYWIWRTMSSLHCDGGYYYLPARIVNNARKAAYRQLRIYAHLFKEPKQHNIMLFLLIWGKWENSYVHLRSEPRNAHW
jgi:hypothetical protein